MQSFKGIQNKNMQTHIKLIALPCPLIPSSSSVYYATGMNSSKGEKEIKRGRNGLKLN